MPPAPSALLCDYGGVLTTSMLGAVEQVCGNHGLDAVAVRDLVRELRKPDDPVVRLERGELEYEAFLAEFEPMLDAACAGALTGNEFLAAMATLVVPEPRMVAAVHRLRAAGVRTALVSNSWRIDLYPAAELAAFDVSVISGRLGMRKPDPEIYLHTLEALGVTAEECCFVDDFEANIATAQALGMQTILHTDPETTLPLLSQMFGVPLDVPPVSCEEPASAG